MFLSHDLSTRQSPNVRRSEHPQTDSDPPASAVKTAHQTRFNEGRTQPGVTAGAEGVGEVGYGIGFVRVIHAVHC